MRSTVLVAVVLATPLASCGYSAEFNDCAVRCDTAGGCPEDLACGSEGLCRTPGQGESCASVLGTPPSCADLSPTCGPTGTDDCCAAAIVPGGMFYRSYDVATDGLYPDTSYPATVSTFALDKYEVTVGRFRAFVAAGQGTRESSPGATAGAHEQIPDSGWDPGWSDDLVADTSVLVAALKCDASQQTWTDAPGPSESLPINCVTWYEAAAFCAWDEGYLPTRAEWNFAASGGSEQRAYPWSSPAGSLVIDCSYANEVHPAGTYCVGRPNRVGSESPKGDGRWGQSDLAGNVLEWTLDWSAPLPTPCVDCAALTEGSERALLSGAFNHDAVYQRNNFVNQSDPAARIYVEGVRCARPVF